MIFQKTLAICFLSKTNHNTPSFNKPLRELFLIKRGVLTTKEKFLLGDRVNPFFNEFKRKFLIVSCHKSYILDNYNYRNKKKTTAAKAHVLKTIQAIVERIFPKSSSMQFFLSHTCSSFFFHGRVSKIQGKDRNSSRTNITKGNNNTG